MASPDSSPSPLTVAVGARIGVYEVRARLGAGAMGEVYRARDTRLGHFTIRCFLQPLEASTHAAHTLPRSYIASVKPGYPAKAVFDPFAARARREGWLYHELPTGHDAQAEMPEALCELLLEIPVE